jgi:hypothetical protein
MKTPLSIYALSGLVGAIGVVPLAAGQSQAPVVSPSSPAKVSLIDAPGLPGALNGAPATWPGSPLDMQCGSLELTQSTDPTLVGANSVWCGTLDFNSETRLARAFTAPHDLSLECVTFAVRENTAADWPCTVRVLLGGTAASYASLTLLTETTVNVPAGTDREMFTAEMPAISIPSGTEFIIELVTPTRDPAAGGDGGLLALGFNSAGESAPTYLYAEACGLIEYQTLASAGFPNRHLALSLGVDQGLVSPTLAGFPISIIGGAVLSELDGEVLAVGDSSADPVGLSVAYGDLTAGVGASFRVLGSGEEVGATVAIEFDGVTTADRLIFRDSDVNPDSAVLALEFDDPAFDTFDVDVYSDGQFVGTLENQISGGVTFTDPGDSTGPWKWLKGLFGSSGEAKCVIEKEYYPDGTIKSSKQSYGLSVGASRIMPSSGGVPVVGDRLVIKPTGLIGKKEPPVSIGFVTTGLPGLAVDIGGSPPVVMCGSAESQLRPKGTGFTTQEGVSFSAVGMPHEPFRLFATDLTGDGVADLRIIPSTLPAAAGEGLVMQLGNFVSATIGMDFVSPDPDLARLSMQLQPDGPELKDGQCWAGLGVGLNGVYTFDAYDIAGSFIYQRKGIVGTAGCTNKQAITAGWSFRGPGFTLRYPSSTSFKFWSGLTLFNVHEIFLTPEYITSEGGDAMLFDFLSFEEVHLFDPEVELPDFGTSCYADCDDSGELDFFDFLCFQNAFASGDPYADCDDSGSLDFFDFLCFQDEFAAGCP